MLDSQTQPESQPAPDQTPLTPVPTAPNVRAENQTPSTPPESSLPAPEKQPAEPIITPTEQPVQPLTELQAEIKPAPEVAPPAPAQTEESSKIKNLLIKAREKIQFRKRAKLEKIISLAQNKGKITNNGVQKLLRVSDATATRYLAELVKQGRLKRVGPTNNASYQLAPPAGG